MQAMYVLVLCNTGNGSIEIICIMSFVSCIVYDEYIRSCERAVVEIVIWSIDYKIFM